MEEDNSLNDLILQLSDLENRVIEAETRADDAEDKVRVMEQRLNEVDWSPNASSNSIHDPKDRLIRSLESEVEQQKLLRLTDAKQVEAKAARIKDWVTNKLRELEEQNDHLKVQNIHCNEQMELLHNRLEQLQVLSASTKSRQTTSITSIEESSSKKSTEDQPIPTPRTAHPRSNRPESESILLPNNGVTSEGGGVLGVTDVLSRHQSLHMSKIMTTLKFTLLPMKKKVPRAWVDSTCTEISDETPSSSGGRTGSGDSGLTGLSPTSSASSSRFPSWEDRIYQVASEGLTVNSEAKMNFQRGAFGCDINVPRILQPLKGASQIRSIPFTGDSSDSSDNEDGGDTGRDTSFDSDLSNDYAIPPDASGGVNSHIGALSYWKSQHDTHRKPQGLISLDESCRVSRNQGSNTFEIATGSKTYYLTADNQPRYGRLGPSTTTKRYSEKRTTALNSGRNAGVFSLGKYSFISERTPNDQHPVGQINMRDSRVEEVENISDSDSDEVASPNEPFVSGGDPKAGTDFEQLIQKLMEEDGDYNSVVLETSSHVPSIIYDCCDGLCWNRLSRGTGSKCNPKHCIDVPELHQELLCALIKQTSRHCASSSKAHQGMQVKRQSSFKHPKSFLMNASQLFSCESNGGSGGTQPKVLATPSGPPVPSLAEATSNCVFIQGWMLLALTVSIFVPKSRKLLWFLRAHLNKNKDQKTETGKYAAYCSRALERSVVNGPRHCKPSRMEVLSILLKKKNPDHHSLPHAVPVHFLNENLSSRWLRWIYNDCRVCDVISRLGNGPSREGNGKKKNEKIRKLYDSCIKIDYSGERIYLEKWDKERLLFCYQVSRQIVQGKFPLNKELAFEIAALMSQIHYGDFEKGSSKCGHSKEALERFFPGRYLSEEEEDFSSMETRLWQFFGAALFSVKMVNEDVPMSIWMSINEEGISILDHSTMQLTSRYPYDSIVTFGGCQEDFMIVINQDADLHPRRCSQESQGSNAKLLFQTEKAIILEITLLVADYMNAIGKQAGPGLMPSTPKLMARHAVSSSGANSRMSNRVAVKKDSSWIVELLNQPFELRKSGKNESIPEVVDDTVMVPINSVDRSTAEFSKIKEVIMEEYVNGT
ncbi:unnamed protein product [Lepeophtheirus salmonis]|uniref:(salmon louse) hypothetical protein n=1 Tax=Lepeophtheirus salmonis TaxID=72036 RepID=A0A7R8H577_LEPSM|nr:unnamed protein product [Lepeophtheirus salmonis]CAF2862648.1 unnamed protein product [Lepeophtheirus salmonis]